MIITGVIFAPTIGNYISQGLSDKLLMLSFSILMILIGVWSLIKAKVMSGSEKSVCKSNQSKMYSSIIDKWWCRWYINWFFGVGVGF